MRFFQSKKNIFTALAVVIMIGALATGLYLYGQRAQAQTSQNPEAMPVTIDIAEKQPIQIWKEFSARMVAVDFAEIRPQVSGNITEVRFEDGQEVVKNDILYVIEPRSFEAAVQQAKAELNAAKNEYSLSQKELSRARKLIKTEAISQSLYDARANTVSVNKASIDSAQAQLTRAEIDLDHAFVKASISGRVSRAEITQGNLVEAGSNAPILTSIVSNAGIYADFDVDEQTYLAHIRSVAKDKATESTIPVRLFLEADTQPYEGFIHSFDNRIDTTSGTIRARAFFEDENNALLPGMFAKVLLGSTVSNDHILISEKAIGTNQDRKFVYVVNDENMTQYQEVSIGNSIDGQRIITQGLNGGERIITEGIIRVRPGITVNPQLREDVESLSETH